MITIKGEYNEAICYTNELESSAEGQIKALCDLPIYKYSKIRMMPDVHAGKGATIGTTMTLHGAVCPNAVGVDISCGMHVIQIKEKHLELEKLDKICHFEIPSGMNDNEENNIHRFVENLHLEDLRCRDNVNIQKATRSLASLGGGNHFTEVDKDEEGNLYVVIHSGSRHLGLEVAEYYQNLAYNQRLSDVDIAEKRNQIIEKLKAEGRQTEIQSALREMFQNLQPEVPKMIAWCTDKVFEDYIHDMKIIEEFAYWNRKAMMDRIIKGMKLHVVDEFTTVHNYIDTENMILRKGSCSAQKGEKLIVPMNMRDGSLICIGKGNPDWNYSAPHGAGRLMSRTEARNTLTVNEFKKQMDGIFTTCVGKDTLDESPMAYKSMNDIVDQIDPTVEIVKVIKPIYNFKAGDEDSHRGKKGR